MPIQKDGKTIYKMIPSDFPYYCRSYLEDPKTTSIKEKVMIKNKILAQVCKVQNELPEIGFTEKDLEKVMYVTISSNYI